MTRGTVPWMRLISAPLMLACVYSIAWPIRAQVTIPEEYGKTIQSAEVVGTLGPDLFGEQVNFYTGATTFVATDVSLPGNNALPVAVGRRLPVGSRGDGTQPGDGMWTDWDLDIPHLEGVFSASKGWAIDQTHSSVARDPQQRCSTDGFGEPLTVVGSFRGVWEPSQYWQGYQLHVPGAGSQELLRAHAGTNPNRPTDGKDYKWVTAQHWYVSCLPATANGYPGEGFLAVSPDGVRYHFDWVATRPVRAITKPLGATDVFAAGDDPDVDPHVPVAQSTGLNRAEVWILPTRVEDRFGNFVTYTYDPANPWRLHTIQSSDGRKLTLGYTDGRISSVSDGTREWRYVETANGLDVVLPDGSKWQYATKALRRADIKPYISGSPVPFCARAGGSATQPIHAGTITHPSGAVGTFRFQSRVHGRSHVKKVCLKSDPTSAADHARYPYLFDAIGLLDKTITGIGLPDTLRWTYTYGPANASWAENCAAGNCATTKYLDVTGPDGWSRYTFSNRWEHSEGKLLKLEQGSSPSNILRTETTTYLMDPTGQRYPELLGLNPFERGDRTSERLQPVIERVIRQDGMDHVWRVGQSGGVYDLDAFGRPTRITRASAQHSRTDALAYEDYTTSWVLGQLASSSNIDTHTVESRTVHDPATALPVQTYAFGALQQNLTYHADGTLASKQDGKGNLTTFADWKRGRPQLIRHPATPDAPDGAIERAVVNDDGTLASTTDATGATSCYAYDALGRLTRITRPSETQPGVCDTSAWASTTIAFTAGNPAAYGMPAGHWRQTTHTGNGRQVVILDALWRPVVEQSLDLGDVGNTIREVFKRYDASGRLAFESVPVNSNGTAHYADAALKGLHTTYDALGRPTRVTQDSELGPLATHTEYLSGGRTRTTDARGQQTTTHHRVFDTPTDAVPIRIEHPERVVTEIARDVFGNPMRVTRSGDAE